MTDTNIPQKARTRTNGPADHSVADEPDILHEILVTTALNQRLLMRILSHLENSSMDRMNREADSFREQFERHYAPDRVVGSPGPDEPVSPGDLPVGREEERRGHDLDTASDDEVSADAPIGEDNATRQQREFDRPKSDETKDR